MICDCCGINKPDVELRPDPQAMEALAMLDTKKLCESCYIDADIPHQHPIVWFQDNKARHERIKVKRTKKGA